MATATKKCVNCKERERNENMKQTPNKQWFCNDGCIAQYANKKYQAKKVKTQKQKDFKRKKELRTRSEWFDILQKLVNKYVREVKEVGEPCCTCGNAKEAYDAGHYKAVGRGGADRRRFNLFNIHNQCRHCNSFGGGKPVEYRSFLIERYGIDSVLWLEDESQHPALKEQFPTTSDIEKEIIRYRQLLRDNGAKANA